MATHHAADIGAFADEFRGWLDGFMADTGHIRWSTIWSTRDNPEETAVRRRLARALGEQGLLFPMFPAELGGGGLDAEHQRIVESELSRYGIDLIRVFDTECCIVAPCILKWGTPEQQAEFIPPMMRGDIDVWQVLTEPQGGSDVATCRTTARRDGDEYVVDGVKTMVGSSAHPDFLWTLVCTDPGGARHENLSWLYIPTDLPGITIQPLPMLMGIKNTVFFDGVRVPASYLVGGENEGWKVSTTHLELEHGGAGTVSRDHLLDRVIAEVRSRSIGGEPLTDRPDVRAVLADMVIDGAIEAAMGKRNFVHRYNRTPHPYGGPQFRYYARMRRLRNSERLQALLGHAALEADLDVDERVDFSYVMRSGPGMLHGGGTLDTDRLILARRMGIGRAPSESAPTTI